MYLEHSRPAKIPTKIGAKVSRIGTNCQWKICRIRLLFVCCFQNKHFGASGNGDEAGHAGERVHRGRPWMAGQFAAHLQLPCQVVSVSAMSTGLWLTSRLDRRPMLLAGFLGSAVAHLLAALSAWLLPDGNAKGMVVLLFLLLFCVFMQCSVTTTTWSVTLPTPSLPNLFFHCQMS